MKPPTNNLNKSFLENKVIVITGGHRGLGKAIAKACVEHGAKVVLAGRSSKELKKALNETQATAAIQCDVSRQKDVKSLVQRVESKIGPIYSLICGAGIYGEIGAFGSCSIEKWVEALEVNLIGTARCIHAALPKMKARGEGRILLFSGGGTGAMTHFSSYVASKGGIWRLTETLGSELAPHGIFVNAIAPGPVNTRFLDDLFSAGREKVGELEYQKAIQQKESGGMSPEKTAELALYLLSSRSEGLHGRILSANYDRYWEIEDPRKLSQTDVFTMRRVVTKEGATKYP